MNRKAFPHLTDAEYAELLRDIETGTAAQKLQRYELYAQALKAKYGYEQLPPVCKALADLMYIAAVNADAELLDTLTKIGETE